jgi:plastocyanin
LSRRSSPFYAVALTGIAARWRRFSLAGILLLVPVACAEQDTGAASPTESPAGTPTPSESPAATCDEPAQTKIDLVAKSVRFNVKCLVVPAGEPLQVELVNRDSVNHNLSIYTLEFSSVFTGDIAYPAERFAYKVPALEVGQYLFQCDIHPRDMEGPLIAQ